MVIGFKLYRKKMFKIERLLKGSKIEFRLQVWGLGINPYRYLAVLKISKNLGRTDVEVPSLVYFRED